MKFGKRLRDLLEDSLPDWRNKFLSYKDLKKKLKSLPSGDASSLGAAGDVGPAESSLPDEKVSSEMSEELFVKLLNEELEKFNSFFMEKEEEFVIRMQVLREEIERVKRLCPNGDLTQCSDCGDQVTDLRKAVVSLHGEIVLLENYSALNYTGLVKILKKHDKRTGLPLRNPFISTVLRQPFLTTDILSKLVKECEQRIHSMFPAYSSAGSQVDDREDVGAGSQTVDRDSPPSSPDSNTKDQQESALDEDIEAVYRSTLTALRSLQEIRGSSKTPHPLLAEAGNFPVISFQRPRDSESNAEKAHHSASSSGAAQGCCSAEARDAVPTTGADKPETDGAHLENGSRLVDSEHQADTEHQAGEQKAAQEEACEQGHAHSQKREAEGSELGDTLGSGEHKRPRTEENSSLLDGPT